MKSQEVITHADIGDSQITYPLQAVDSTIDGAVMMHRKFPRGESAEWPENIEGVAAPHVELVQEQGYEHSR
jgi:hypothetical protein